ncbi:glycosyltransferase family 47 protein [Patescibacteria group bacterium]|nr:glycosyltransferase family 47 protein [Patescibacteria group bacterium]
MKSKSQKRNNLDHVFYFGKDNRCVRWSDCESIEKSYWTEVLKNIASSFEIIVTENTEYLPKYGNNVIVILKSDELISDIKYTTRVRAIFRNYFDKKYIYNKNIFFLPLPCLGGTLDIPNIPILNRETDVFFAGQVNYSIRKELSKIVLNLKSQKKDLKIVFKKTKDFFSGWDINQYLDRLNNSKICLCPRGASIETYRHFEALRHGCIVISTSLPNVWYFQNAPIQTITQWNELPDLVNKIIRNQGLLKEISKKSVKYWNDKLSPKAVANFINNSIDSIS